MIQATPIVDVDFCLVCWAEKSSEASLHSVCLTKETSPIKIKFCVFIAMAHREKGSHSDDVVQTFDPLKRVSSDGTPAQDKNPLYPRITPASHSGDPINIILIGRTGSGKSSCGNIILGKNKFEVHTEQNRPFTGKEKTEYGEANGHRVSVSVSVTETPDYPNLKIPDTEKEKMVEQLKKENGKPDAMLFCINYEKIDNFNKDYEFFHSMLDLWRSKDDFCRRLFLTFTFADQQYDLLQEARSKPDVLRRINPKLDQLMQDVKGRFLVFGAKTDAVQKNKTQIDFMIDHISIEAAKELQDSNELQFLPHSPAMSTNKCSILIIGKTGNGKSSLGNTLIGKKVFAVGRGMSTQTRESNLAAGDILGKPFNVVDTEDIHDLDPKKKEEAIKRWKEMTQPGLTAILLVVRCEVRYTPEEHAIYREIKNLWGNPSEFTNKLIIAFTFGDLQDTSLEQELKTGLYPELSDILKNSGRRYVMFKNKGNETDRLDSIKNLSKHLENMNTEQGAESWDRKVAGDGFEVLQMEIDDNESTTKPIGQHYRAKRTDSISLIIVGRTGSGKSSLGNALLGKEEFMVSSGMRSTTEVAKLAHTTRADGLFVKVVDTPDVSGKAISAETRRREVIKWRDLISGKPSAILLTIRCSAKYTRDEFDIYQELKKTFRLSTSNWNLIVVFTFEDQKEVLIEDELKKNGELQTILQDANGRYIFFSKKGNPENKQQKIENLYKLVDEIGKWSKGPDPNRASAPVDTYKTSKGTSGYLQASPGEANCFIL